MALSTALKTTGAACLGSGALHVLMGPNFALRLFGAPPWSPVNVIVGSEYRFFGGVWAGYGAMLWWVSNDVRARRTPLAILMGSMVFGAVGRLAAGAAHGFGSRLMVLVIGIEFAIPLIIGGLTRAELGDGDGLA
ncbi:hypothetical protein HJFPF1_11067 [Paramyrothecium foliicola]|nr:hypothetical protein HJFPF1_11067 [Paramyrothecium foliicola]